MANKKPKSGLTQQRSIDLAIREVNEDERRVTVSFSSEKPVSRWYGQEILSHDEGCMNLERLNSIGVALWNHNRNIVIGKIENATCNSEEKRGYADIVFDDDEESERIYQKVKSGTIKGVSVGYRVDSWEEVKAGVTSSNGRFTGPAEVALRWSPYEISIVSVPADESVGVGRELEENHNEREECNMPGAINETNPNNGEQQRSQTDIDRERQEGVRAERQRVTEISNLCRDFDIDPQEYIDNGSAVEKVRTEILEKLRTNNNPLENNQRNADVMVTKAEEDKIRAAASDGLLMRAGRTVENPVDGANEYRGVNLRSLAVDCLVRAGVSNAHRLDDYELFRRSVTPDSQFTAILSDSVHKSMATAYKAAKPTFQSWCGKGSNTDFKAATHYQISEAGELKKMTQTGEFDFDEMKDQGVTKAIATYGRKFGFTRKAMIDDDLSILTKVPTAYVRAAARGINKLVYSMLTSNPVIFDGKNLFEVEHKNIDETGATINTTSLGVGTASMRKQKNLRAKETLNIAPKFLITGPDKEVEARKVLTSVADPASQNSGVANVFRSAYDLVIDAEIEGNAWYLAADPRDIDTIEVTYLNGKDMPTLESRVGFDFLGIEWRIFIDYGVNVLDFRGLYKNNGASS